MTSDPSNSSAGVHRPTWDGDAVLDCADVAIYAVDADGRCIRYNQAAEALLGYTKAEALGHDMHELVHNRYPDGRPYPAAECQLLQAQVAGIPRKNMAEVLWAKSGQTLLVECSIASFYDDGHYAGTVVTIKDVRDKFATEERQRTLVQEQAEALRQRDAAARIERELTEAESQRRRESFLNVERVAAAQLLRQQDLLSAVAEMAPVGIAVIDAAHKYRWHNRCYKAFLDAWDQGLPNGSGDQGDGNAEPAASEIDGILHGVLASGKTFSADEFKVRAADATSTYWRLSVSRLSADDLMVIVMDVTGQVNARREIEAIYATAPIALALVDAKDYRYLRVNEEQSAILGLRPAEVVGRPVDDFQTVPELKGLLERATAGEVIATHAVGGAVAGSPDASRQWLLNVVPNRDSEDRIHSLSVAGIEVTAQRRAEEALMQADKLASVGRLVSSISHEINNPLEAVTNLLYLIHQDPDLSAEAFEYIKMAEGEIARVSQIAAQTLRFHRHAVGVVARTPQQIVEPVVALYRGRLKNSHVELETVYSDQQPVVCREGDVRQILNNLVGNAIDAMGSGGRIRIRTRAARCSRTGKVGTRISVSDSGHGMPIETISHIFEPFYTTKGAGGSGLGLWISHTLAERQGGKLQVRSCSAGVRASGESGTTFSLFLPNTDTAASLVQ